MHVLVCVSSRLLQGVKDVAYKYHESLVPTIFLSIFVF